MKSSYIPTCFFGWRPPPSSGKVQLHKPKHRYYKLSNHAHAVGSTSRPHQHRTWWGQMLSTLEEVQNTRDRRCWSWHSHNTWHYGNHI